MRRVRIIGLKISLFVEKKIRKSQTNYCMYLYIFTSKSKRQYAVWTYLVHILCICVYAHVCNKTLQIFTYFLQTRIASLVSQNAENSKKNFNIAPFTEPLYHPLIISQLVQLKCFVWFFLRNGDSLLSFIYSWILNLQTFMKIEAAREKERERERET